MTPPYDPKRVCENCAWWEAAYDRTVSKNVGSCRYAAPVIHTLQRLWPNTHGEDWCRAYQSRSEYEHMMTVNAENGNA